MSNDILLAVDAASGDPAGHMSAAAVMTRELARDTGTTSSSCTSTSSLPAGSAASRWTAGRATAKG